MDELASRSRWAVKSVSASYSFWQYRPLRPGGEVRDDAVAEHRAGHGADVLHRHVEPALQHGPRLAGDNQVQAGARAGTVAEPLADELRRIDVVGPGAAHEFGGVLVDVL